MGNPVRVMVVDDSSSTRTMLREALALGGDIDVVGEAGGGREAISMASECSPDVVLMDVRMPDMDGVTAARSLLNEHPEMKVVALTWSDDPSTPSWRTKLASAGQPAPARRRDEGSAGTR